MTDIIRLIESALGGDKTAEAELLQALSDPDSGVVAAKAVVYFVMKGDHDLRELEPVLNEFARYRLFELAGGSADPTLVEVARARLAEAPTWQMEFIIESYLYQVIGDAVRYSAALSRLQERLALGEAVFIDDPSADPIYRDREQAQREIDAEFRRLLVRGLHEDAWDRRMRLLIESQHAQGKGGES